MFKSIATLAFLGQAAYGLSAPVLYEVKKGANDTTAHLAWRPADADARITRVLRKSGPSGRFEQKAYLWYQSEWTDATLDYGTRYYYALIGDDGSGNTDTSNVDSITTPPRPRICSAPELKLTQNIDGQAVVQIVDKCNAETGYVIRRQLDGGPMETWRSIPSVKPVEMKTVTIVDTDLQRNAWAAYQAVLLPESDSLASKRQDFFLYDHRYAVTQPYRELKPGNLLATFPMNDPYWTMRIGDTLFAAERKGPESTFSVIALNDPSKPKFVGYRTAEDLPTNENSAFWSEGKSLFRAQRITVGAYLDTDQVTLDRYTFEDGRFLKEYQKVILNRNRYGVGGIGQFQIAGKFNDSTLYIPMADKYALTGSYKISTYMTLVRIRDGVALKTVGTTDYRFKGFSNGTLIAYSPWDEDFSVYTSTPFYSLHAIRAQDSVFNHYTHSDTLLTPPAGIALRPGMSSATSPYTQALIYGYPTANLPEWRFYSGMLITDTSLIHSQTVYMDTANHLLYALNPTALKVFDYSVSVGVRPSVARSSQGLTVRIREGRTLLVTTPEGWDHSQVELLDMSGRRLGRGQALDSHTFLLNRDALRRGLYFIRATSSGRALTLKWMMGD